MRADPETSGGASWLDQVLYGDISSPMSGSFIEMHTPPVDTPASEATARADLDSFLPHG